MTRNSTRILSNRLCSTHIHILIHFETQTDPLTDQSQHKTLITWPTTNRTWQNTDHSLCITHGTILPWRTGRPRRTLYSWKVMCNHTVDMHGPFAEVLGRYRAPSRTIFKRISQTSQTHFITIQILSASIGGRLAAALHLTLVLNAYCILPKHHSTHKLTLSYSIM